jgi:demethylmenaquinone methyltransferase/2-methoxy-6-polyprenyl-1,4-benzoquinol methylase
MANTVDSAVLSEMIDYYRARAAEYDEWWDRTGRYDHGPDANQRWMREREEVYAAFDAMKMGGHVLELAPGTGTWTRRIVKTAAEVTMVDASPEMLALNVEKVGNNKVRRLVADLFEWKAEKVYDGVVFGFWLSHVPMERLDEFLQRVASWLRPGGALFFLDGLREPGSTAKDHVLPQQDQQVMTRKLNDGRAYRIVKNFYEARELERHCRAAGLAVEVKTTATYFYYGIGRRMQRETP